MAASDHLNGGQMVKMYHISWDDTPPHELKPKTMHEYKGEDNNIHPDVLHMGTKESALALSRTHLHEYEVDPKDIEPVVYGDAQWLLEQHETRPELGSVHSFNKRMRGKQEGLWETVPGNVLEAAGGKIIPYRNRVESAGDISYMVPKSAIRSGKVRHVGVTDVEKEGLREKMRKERQRGTT